LPVGGLPLRYVGGQDRLPSVNGAAPRVEFDRHTSVHLARCRHVPLLSPERCRRTALLLPRSVRVLEESTQLVGVADDVDRPDAALCDVE
jgi:hypothetical protein